MASVDFRTSASQLVELIGGKANISKVAHCITRVRFTLNDPSIASANMNAVKQIPGVLQVVEAGGQYQVVIGPQVERMYDAVIALTGDNGSEETKDTESSSKTKPVDFVMKLVSGIMMPMMPALIGCGIISALYNVLSMLNLVTADSGIGCILYAIGQACMYFFPVLVGGSAAKFFGLDVYLGNVVGAAMMYPTLVAAAGAGEITSIFGIIPLTFKDYTSTVFPAIATVWFASVVYKLIKKVMPDILRFTLIPPLTLLITVPVSLLVIGPVVNVASGAISTGMLAIYNLSPILCGIILGGTWVLFIVPLGLHWGFLAIFMNNIITLGYEPIMGLMAGIMGYSGTLLAIAFKSKNPENRSAAIGCAVSNAFGISEPGLYGFILQHKQTIIASSLGGAIAGIIPAVCHSAIYVMGSSAGIFALPAYINPNGDMTSLIGAVLCNVVAFVLCFAFTYIAKFDPDN